MRYQKNLSKTATAGLYVAILILAGAPAIAQFGPSPVETAPVVQRTIQTGQTFVGTVEPIRESTIGSEAEGKVISVEVEEGDFVQTGDILVRLDAESLEIQLDAARAELEFRQAQLEELRNGSRPEEIKEAEARLGAARADRSYWKSQYERIKRLNEQKVSSVEAVQDAERSLERAQQQMQEAEAALELVREGPRKERIAQALASVRKQEHEIRLLQDRIDDHSVRAPFDGFITLKNTEMGQWLSNGDPVVEMVELNFVDIESSVPEDNITALSKDDEARVEITALPGRFFTGYIVSIVPQADATSRTFPVQVRVENPFDGDKALIKAGMFARVTLSVGNQQDALLVPKDALVLGGPTPSVIVAAPSEQDPETFTAKPVPVRLGASSEGYIEVTGQLSVGDPVVVLGNERLMPGQAIVPQPRTEQAAGEETAEAVARQESGSEGS